MTFQLRKLGTAAIVCMLTLTSSFSSYATPGVLPSIPLINTNQAVDPNIFFTVDDSGSMAWEIIFRQGATQYSTDQGLPIVNGYRRPYIIPGFGNYNIIPSLANDPDSWIFRNHIANPIYYDSFLEYEPWQGSNSSGLPLYNDANINAIKDRPDDGSSSSDINITLNKSSRYLPTFCLWDNDNNGDGVDPSDDHTCVEIKAGNEASFPSGRSYADELQNFANWMQYYRTRELASKASIGTVINTTDGARMGLRFINSGHKLDPKPMSDSNNKRELLSEYYSDSPGGGTPLRNALKYTGNKFINDSDFILPEAKGGACQQNYNILMTDGYWNGSDPSGIDDEDSDNNSSFDGNKNQSIDEGNYADGYSRTLADVAMYYYENDLSGLENKVPVKVGTDLADHQHLVNYTIAFGLRGSLPADADPLATGFKWPKPVANTDTTLDDLRHAAYNSRGLFLSASNSQVLLEALLAAVVDITDRTTTAAAAAVTSAKLTTESIVYLSEYNTINWQGDILAHKIKTDANGNVLKSGELQEIPEWSAGDRLRSLASPRDSREILTYDRTGTRDGVPFEWDHLSTPMKNDLKTTCSTTSVSNPPPGSCIQLLNKVYCPVTRKYYRNTCPSNDRLKRWPNGVKTFYCYDPNAGSVSISNSCTLDTDDVAKARLDYIRGDHSNEGTGLDFRQRHQFPNGSISLLGDIVNSGPVYVGTPSLNFPDSAPFPTGTEGYSKFKASLNPDKGGTARTGVVYSGSNDGMFHAFHEATGDELFAYIPSYLASTEEQKGLHYLTDKRYNHMFYNDLTATLSDVYINSGGGSGWRTVLVSGQRAGGRGYFALDVTNPATFNEGNASNIVMWEFSSDDDPDLGFSYSRAQIGMLDDGTWVAIFGNGYNSTGTGEAKLFIVKLEGGTDGIWTEGTDYFKISAGTPTVSSPGTPNGLSTPALADIDGDGTIDRAYAGDLNGEMWVFDLNGSLNSGELAYNTPLFTTEGEQPITAKPILSFHPSQPNEPTNTPNLMVFFGSGQFLVTGDKTTTHNNYFYGVWDKGETGKKRGDLVDQTFRSSFAPIRVLTKNTVDYSTKFGWNIPLDVKGERSITNPAVRGDIVFFNTAIPTNDPCTSGGYGYRFAVDLTTGGTPDEPVIDRDDQGVIDSSDTVGQYHDVESAALIEDGIPPEDTFTDENVPGRNSKAIIRLTDPRTGRFSWQELLK